MSKKPWDLSSHPELVWVGPIFLAMGLVAMWLGLDDVFKLSFISGAAVSAVVYSCQGAEMYGSRERSDWKVYNNRWIHGQAAALGWAILYYFLSHRLEWLCECNGRLPIQLEILYQLKGVDIVMLVFAFWGISGQLPRILAFDWFQK